MIALPGKFVIDISRDYKYVGARESRAVTIGVGFQCRGGAVLCADSQITKEGGLKYNEKKIYTIGFPHSSSPDYRCITMCYAGSPDMMKLLCEKMDKEFVECPPPSEWGDLREGRTWNQMLSGLVEKILRDIYKVHGTKSQLEVISAVFSKRDGVSMYCARGSVVRRSNSAECIGVGDSSILRFLSDLFVRPSLTIPQALTLGCYMVAKAKTYIAGCGGPTQAFFITHKGKARNLSDVFVDGLAPDDGLEKTERAIANLLHAVSGSGRTKETTEAALAEFRKSLSEIEINWPLVLEYKTPNYFEE